MKDPVIRNMRRRLERWELDHLRQLAASLHEELTSTQAALAEARDEAARQSESADFWNRHAMDLQENFWAAGGEIGLTMNGALVASAPVTQVAHA